MNATFLEQRSVSKSRGRPKASNRNDMTVRVDRTIVGKAKLVATHLGLEGGVAELLSDLVREPVDRAYGQMVQDLGSGGSGGPSVTKRKRGA